MIPVELKEEYPFNQNFLFISNGIKMNYIDEGEGQPILMLHGNPTWSFFYRNLAKELKKTNRVIVPDHVGCGLSDKPLDYQYTLENHIQNIERLVERLQLHNITMIVHDWGGAIGFGYATRHMTNIKRIVILNTAAYTFGFIPFRINLCKIPLIGEWFIRTFNGFAYPATFMASEKKLSPLIKQGYLLPYNNYDNRIATARFVKDIPMNDKHPSFSTLLSIEKRLPQLTCPKLILWGEKDFCFNLKFLKRWKEIYPDTPAILLKNTGHYVTEDAKDELIEKIRGFLS